jgi:ketosteroid isomerase-like protein
MKKKNLVNIMLFGFIIIYFFVISCNKSSKESIKGILLKTDRDFSAMSAEKGMHKAFLFYIDKEGVMLRNNAFPLEGKESLSALFVKGDDTGFTLRWEPLFEKLSQSCDLGYTYGIFSQTNKSTGQVSKGTYVTIWEKQGDGTWKFVLDTGTQGLPEQSK